MMKRFVLAFLLVALAVASAKTYSVTLWKPSTVSGTELKAGEYKLNVQNDKVVLTNGKQSVESAVKVEQSESKFGTTTVRFAEGDGKAKIQEIRLGGTTMRLVFSN